MAVRICPWDQAFHSLPHRYLWRCKLIDTGYRLIYAWLREQSSGAYIMNTRS
jgi:hypothetical protein